MKKKKTLINREFNLKLEQRKFSQKKKKNLREKSKCHIKRTIMNQEIND